MSPAPPTVSVIMAAYNRSNVLRYAVSSVIWQTFRDWELIVVDDASTDDTGEVVASFCDPRIRYHKLDKNIGEQSGPNNIGLAHARGRYIAYLNQDDLWFPDHLERLIECMNETDADWVCAPAYASDGSGGLRLYGAMPGDRFSPEYGRAIFATQWMIKKTVLDKIGPWRFYRSIRITPSQELLLRAWKSGVEIRTTRCVTVLVIHSAPRAGSYSRRLDEDNRLFYEAIAANPRFRDELTMDFCLEQEKSALLESLKIPPAIYRLLATGIKRIGLVFGVMPGNLSAALRLKKKGSIVDAFRENRGLPKLRR